MSDSPKYSTASLLAEQERRIRQERERQAALERARREAEEERRRQARLEQDRKVARHGLAEAQDALKSFSNAEGSRFVSSKRIEELRSRLGQIEIAIRDSDQEGRLRD